MAGQSTDASGIDQKYTTIAPEQGLEEVNQLLEEAQAVMTSEEDKQNKWKKENERRRHNYVPLIFKLLEHMGKKGMLEELLEDAVQKKKEKVEAEKAKNDKKNEQDT